MNPSIPFESIAMDAVGNKKKKSQKRKLANEEKKREKKKETEKDMRRGYITTQQEFCFLAWNLFFLRVGLVV
jgi:hypothetical protein